ncbi:hypothetical protein [Ancylomarina longa]|uniref:Uncharacterized protein n=1 Tax=Ancylomarina longa TaxID=2487017 RepID=A0A434AYQ8_9BACT|nr:hypothetical protein [Ancylomarina longa]RUT79605.1 hypothetical protein DLK05_02630 [Ancylomarina longa]
MSSRIRNFEFYANQEISGFEIEVVYSFFNGVDGVTDIYCMENRIQLVYDSSVLNESQILIMVSELGLEEMKRDKVKSNFFRFLTTFKKRLHGANR